MKRSSLSIALYLLLVFISGIAAGAFGHWLYTTRTVNAVSRRPSPEEYRRRYLEEMKTRLKLSPDQLDKLNAILDETRKAFRETHERYRPEHKAIQDRQSQQVLSILTDAQRAEYEKMRQEREERMKKYRKDRGF